MRLLNLYSLIVQQKTRLYIYTLTICCICHKLPETPIAYAMNVKHFAHVVLLGWKIVLWLKFSESF